MLSPNVGFWAALLLQFQFLHNTLLNRYWIRQKSSDFLWTESSVQTEIRHLARLELKPRTLSSVSIFPSGRASTKTSMSCTDDIFPRYIPVREALGHINVYTTTDMRLNSSQTISTSGLSDWICEITELQQLHLWQRHSTLHHLDDHLLIRSQLVLVCVCVCVQWN